MTNLEKIKDEIANMNARELFRWKVSRSPWCEDGCGSRNCENCAVDWLRDKYEEPMPKLKNGMFVEVSDCGFGVVVNDEIVCQDGTHDKIDDLKEYITKVFEATCFIDCEDDVGIIWERN